MTGVVIPNRKLCPTVPPQAENGWQATIGLPMQLRATYRAPGAPRYRRPGGAWDVPTLDAAISARPVQGAPAVVDGERRIGAEELERLVASVAGGLRRRGIRRGDVVSWQLPNSWEALVLLRACWRAGAVAAPIHHQVGAGEIPHMLEVLEPSLTLSSPHLPLSEHQGVLPVRGERDAFAELFDARPVTKSPNRPSDLAVVIFTSGSTGRPKAALHTHRGLVHKALTMAKVHGLGGADAVLMPAPMAHVSGLLYGVLVPGVAAMKSVVMERWDGEKGLGLMESERISLMIGPPSLFSALIELAGFRRERVASMRVISTGMMGVSPAFIEAAREATGAIVKRAYGSTEAPSVSTCTNDDPPERCRDTDGRSVGEAEIVAVDPVTRRRRPPGAVGEIWIRGPELFVGYADPADTAAAVHRGWYRTGDLGRVAEEGWLEITGRLRELIIRGGENISSTEVEHALERHPEVVQAVVVGMPDERLGERVAAFVVSRSDVGLEEVRRWFGEVGMARFKTPEVVVRVERLPLLAAGKPDRATLRARAVDLARSGR